MDYNLLNQYYRTDLSRKPPANLYFNKKNKEMLYKWLFDVFKSQLFHVHESSLFLTYSILDYYFSVSEVKIDRIQAIGVSAFYLSCEYHADAMDLADAVYICSFIYTKNNIIDACKEILNTINYNLDFITIYDYIQLYFYYNKHTMDPIYSEKLYEKILNQHINFNTYNFNKAISVLKDYQIDQNIELNITLPKLLIPERISYPKLLSMDYETQLMENKIIIIGMGTYGCVKAIQDKYAIKSIPYMNNTPYDYLFIREVSALVNFSESPNFVEIKGISQYENHQVIVMELCDMDLSTAISKIPDKIKEIRKKIIYEILLGIEYLHERGYAHRDLKSANILLKKMDNTYIVKIADLGMVRKILDEDGVLSRSHSPVVCTLHYRAPEMLFTYCKKATRQYTNKIDLWSVGCILLEMILGRNPFKARGELETISKIATLLGPPPSDMLNIEVFIKRKYLWKKISSDQQELDLLKHLLVYNPDERYSASQALAHPYFRDEIVSQVL